MPFRVGLVQGDFQPGLELYHFICHNTVNGRWRPKWPRAFKARASTHLRKWHRQIRTHLVSRRQQKSANVGLRNVFVHSLSRVSPRFVLCGHPTPAVTFLRRGHGQLSKAPSELNTMHEADRRTPIHLTYYARNGNASRTDRGPPLPTG
jgi:hypothetical protein